MFSSVPASRPPPASGTKVGAGALGTGAGADGAEGAGEDIDGAEGAEGAEGAGADGAGADGAGADETPPPFALAHSEAS